MPQAVPTTTPCLCGLDTIQQQSVRVPLPLTCVGSSMTIQQRRKSEAKQEGTGTPSITALSSTLPTQR